METSVYDYSDFREYIRAFVAEKQRSNSSYSFRFLASKLECNPGFFNRVLKGERNLTSEYQLKIVKLFGLQKRERNYFELLVGYNQAKKELEKDHLYTQLKQFTNAAICRISEEQYGLYDEWYNVVLRDMLNVYPIYEITDETCDQLGKHLQPSVQGSTIKKGIGKLLELGLIEQDKTGRLQLTDQLISTGTQIPPEIVRRILRQFFQLGTSALTRFAPEDRVCSAVSVSVSSEGYDQIKAKLEQTRKEILEIAKADSNVDSVYHMNIQLFPVSL